jgi:hypothetical protein
LTWDDVSKRHIDLEPLGLHFDDPAGDPIAVLEHDDCGLHREGNGGEEGDEQADGEKSLQKKLVHQKCP